MENKGSMQIRLPLWTKSFTIATVGSLVSMLGSSVSGFALGLLVLNETGSTLLYAIYAVVYQVPKVLLPILAGPYLDRFSRRKSIYTLDFISTALFLGLFFLLRFNLGSYPILLLFCIVIGGIDSVYQVSYESLYPMLISNGNYSRAYSVASMLNPLAALMLPVAAYISEVFPNNIEFLFLFNAVSFCIAAICETQIRVDETHALVGEEKKNYGFKKYAGDFKVGLAYLKNEKGLLTIVSYFFINTIVNAAIGILILPYFKGQTGLGVLTYTFVQCSSLLGRVVGGVLHYKIEIPTGVKFTIAMCVYVSANLIGCGYLFVPIIVMLIMQFISGVICVTSYNIRISSTQNYIPNEMRGRFNGIFQMLMAVGAILGQLIAGMLGDMFPDNMRVLILCLSSIDIIAIFAVMLRGRSHVKKIYNVRI